jgi:hypothetical protein
LFRIAAEEIAMQANDNSTNDSSTNVVDKAVNFVKDALGIQHNSAPEVQAKPEYHDTEPEVADAAMSLDPNVYEGLVPPESGTVFEDDPQRPRRDAAGFPRSEEDR